MKQILIISGTSVDPEDVQEITDFAAGIRATTPGTATVHYAHLDQLSFAWAPGDFRITDTRQKRGLHEYDLIILRSKMRKYSALAYCISRFCADRAIRFFNSYENYFTGTKISQAVLFYEQQLPFLKTIYALDRAVLLETMQQELPFPCILKDAHGSHGRSNYVVHTAEEAEQVLAREPQAVFIAQEYCPNDHDYRILVMDDDHIVLERRGVDGSHLNNTSQGAKAALAPDAVPTGILQQSHTLATKMQLHIAGIDVIPNLHTGALYFLEVNSQPQIFTGALLEEKAQHFAAFMRRQLGG